MRNCIFPSNSESSLPNPHSAEIVAFFRTVPKRNLRGESFRGSSRKSKKSHNRLRKVALFVEEYTISEFPNPNRITFK